MRRTLTAFVLAIGLLISLVGTAFARDVKGTTIPDNPGTLMACMGMGGWTFGGGSGPHMPITGDGCVTE